MISTVVLIVAAGRGHRVGGEIPKQYIRLEDVPVLHMTVSAFLDHPAVDEIRVVIHPDDRPLYDEAVRGLNVLDPVTGGSTRQESVLLGLESLESLSPDTVLIHDAARPYIDTGSINRVLGALTHASGALPVLPVTDTLKLGMGRIISETIDRSTVWRAQTPQGFLYNEILNAHRQMIGQKLTDDASVAEAVGLEVVMVDGDPRNVKITTMDDLSSSRQRANAYEFRTGAGFDVHRFGPGESVTLCGIEIPHSQALVGHSDADVAFHALTDALLGAIGRGDIGQHFPPTDEQWRGVSSDQFLSHSVKLMRECCGDIVNIDVTVICEAPKIGPYRGEMEKRIAQIVGADESRINVKATTTEQLGFTGRREGIAAQAVVSVKIDSAI